MKARRRSDGADSPKAFYILIEALPGFEDEMVQMLRDFFACVADEPATGPWYAVRHSADFEAFLTSPDAMDTSLAGRHHLPRCCTHEPSSRQTSACAEGRDCAQQDVFV